MTPPLLQGAEPPGPRRLGCHQATGGGYFDAQTGRIRFGCRKERSQTAIEIVMQGCAYKVAPTKGCILYSLLLSKILFMLPLQEAMSEAVKFSSAALAAVAMPALMQAGASVHGRAEDSVAPIHRAAVRPDGDAARVIEVLVANGADANAESSCGLRPLAVAAQNRHAAAATANVRALVAAGAAVNHKGSEDGGTPLHYAAINPSEAAARAAVQALIDSGAAVNSECSSGLQPLHWGILGNENARAAARWWQSWSQPAQTPMRLMLRAGCPSRSFWSGTMRRSAPPWCAR